MVDCKKCVHYSRCDIAHDFAEHVKRCRDFKPQTNADRIRAMSDEELAEFLTEHHKHPCKYCVDCWTESGGSCIDERMKWLKSEVKEW